MKNTILIIICLLFFVPFFCQSQERVNEARPQLQLSMDGFSERLMQVTGWYRNEDKDGKTWVSSRPGSYISYIPNPNSPDRPLRNANFERNWAFEYIELFKFSLENQVFYLMVIKMDENNMRVFALKKESVTDLQKIVSMADGNTHTALKIMYNSDLEDDEVRSFNPESFIRDKNMIRALLLNDLSYKKQIDNTVFLIISQVIKGEKIIRFNINFFYKTTYGIPEGRWNEYVDEADMTTVDTYFECKASDFEKLFIFSSYENYENKRREYYLNKREYERKITQEIEAQSNEMDDDGVYFIVEVMPMFGGGEEGLRTIISNSIVYPTIAQENGIQGKVYVKFVIDKDGSVIDAEVVKSVDPLLDKEALRVVNSLPKWLPGKRRGKPVKVSYTVPINFQLY